MSLRKLGSTGLSIGPLGLGSVNFSWLTDEKDSFAILDAAFERGVNLLDTSDNYNAGPSEALIGRWFVIERARRSSRVATRTSRSQTDVRANSGSLACAKPLPEGFSNPDK